MDTDHPFTNIHTHIFSSHHAPDYFLKTAIPTNKLPERLDNLIAIKVKELIQRRGSRIILGAFDWIFKLISRDYRETVERYLDFILIGSSSTQKEIFDDIAKAHVKYANYRIIILTQVLDYLDMDLQSNHIKIQTQVEQVCELKRNALYQQHIFPFLGVDPRMQGIDLMKEWVQKYISRDKGFWGIKLYPAYGYFPFDERFDKIFAWAEENEIPVMSHCTRGGSWYLGRFDSIVSSGGLNITSLNESSAAMKQIRARIDSLLQDTATHKNNHLWCNIFGHPENYRPVLEKYPKLKICLAHLGGSSEILRKYDPANKEMRKTDYPSYFQDNWYDMVIGLMKDFNNVYTDISYTLSSRKALEYINTDFITGELKDGEGELLFKRVMYGTDFYLTLQEEIGEEPDLQKMAIKCFDKDAVNLLTRENPAKYLFNKINKFP